MIELVFLACMAAAPQFCEERSQQFVDVSVMTCMMGAQPNLAKWAGEHPDWRIVRWKCRVVDFGRADI